MKASFMIVNAIICSILFFLFSNFVIAQSSITGEVSQNDVYTDFESNLNIICGASPHFEGDSSYYIDVDQNGIYDFVFRSVYFGALGGGTGEITISGLNDENRILSHIETNEVYPGDNFITVNVADTISESIVLSLENIFTIGKSYLLSSYYGPVDDQPFVSTWNNCGEHFIGFRIKPNQDTLYGWIRVEMFTDNFPDSLVVKDMACNINEFAGKEDFEFNNIEIYPIPAKDYIYINTINSDVIEDIEIFSISGNLVKTDLQFNKNYSIDISDLHNGHFFLLIRTKDKLYRRKIFKL